MSIKKMITMNYFIIILLLIIYKIECTRIRYPKIEIESWMTIDSISRNWDIHNLTGLLEKGEVNVIRKGIQLTYIISQHLDRIRMSCSAPYPITWNPEEDEESHLEELHYHGLSDYRIAQNIRDSKTFIFKSIIELYSSATPTRNYTCQRLSNPGIQRSVYLYWEGSSYLVFGGETIDVQTKDNLTVILPCRVSKPEVTVQLFKDSDNGYVELFLNNSIVFEPQIGFTLNLHDLPSVYGRYKCVSGDDIESDEIDSVRINILRGIRPSQPKTIFNQTIIGNATFSYDTKNRKISCCSNSSKAPNLRFSFCRNQMTCKRKERFLKKISSVNRNLWMANGGCSNYEIYPRESGILRCRGDGIDIFRYYYAGVIEVNGSFPIYFSIHDIDPDQLVNIMPSYEDLVYANLNFTVYCDTADYYFSHGLHWAVKYKNNSLHFLDAHDPNELIGSPGYETHSSSYNSPIDFHSVLLTADLEMYSITCFAPIWNSSLWVRKEFLLNIKEAVLPSIEMIETVHWKLNETGRNISCLVNGKPSSFIRWRKNNKTVIGDTNIRVTRENETSIIAFHHVSHGSQGEYICMASNIAGMVTKTVYVYVEGLSLESSSSASTIIFVATIGLLIFLGAIAGLVWKLKLQKNIIDHLTGVVFRDVGK